MATDEPPSSVAPVRGRSPARPPREFLLLELAARTSEILRRRSILLLANGGKQTFGIFSARSTVGEVDEEIGESLWNRIAARDDVAVLVDEVQSSIASGIASRSAKQLVESMIGHDTRSAWPASVNARRSLARAS